MNQLIRNVALLFITFLFFGCLVADEIFLAPQEPEVSLQTRAEQSIQEYILKRSETETYNSYGFSELVVKKPVLIHKLDSLDRVVQMNPKNEIARQNRDTLQALVRANKIQRTAVLEHFFTLKSDSTDFVNVFEIKYTLDDTLGVLQTDPKIILTIPASYKTLLDYYFYEYTLFIAPTYAEARQMSRKFYQYFKAQQEELSLTTRKSDFLKHTLEICKLVKVNGKFEQDRIVQGLFKLYMKERRKDIKLYEPIAFSSLFETIEENNDSLIGYYFFHKFTGEYAGAIDTNAVLIEMSPYYEIDQVFQLDQPYENYVN
jgi:hypothetical protein